MKLEGVRVLDLSAFLPGPHLTMTLSDHGADVIMVEPANGVGEPTRAVGYRDSDDVSVWFRNIARGKRSLRVNLKDAEGRRFFHRLAEGADVVVESFRPGVAARLGVDYETLAATNPRLVYCSISAFGQNGPLRDKPAHDLTVQALAGVAALNRGLEDGKPAAPNIPAADAISSLTALSAILMALLRRERTGRGEYIDIAMYDALLAWTPNVTGPVFAEDAHPEPANMRSFGGSAMYRIYETSDGEFLVLGGSEVKFARNLLAAFERLDLLPFAELEPGPVQEPLRAFFRERFRSRPRAHWERFLEPVDCCWAFVRSLKDAFDDPHTIQREMLLRDATGHRHIGVPIKFAKEPARPRLELPAYGQHSAELGESVGLASADLAALRARGTI
ncbi:MAG: CoA transferase [Gammaproteobacteria bacterium]|nr:CoA transferase [Gammaproteobacteria bacterium]